MQSKAEASGLGGVEGDERLEGRARDGGRGDGPGGRGVEVGEVGREAAAAALLEGQALHRAAARARVRILHSQVDDGKGAGRQAGARLLTGGERGGDRVEGDLESGNVQGEGGWELKQGLSAWTRGRLAGGGQEEGRRPSGPRGEGHGVRFSREAAVGPRSSLPAALSLSLVRARAHERVFPPYSLTWFQYRMASFLPNMPASRALAAAAATPLGEGVGAPGRERKPKPNRRARPILVSGVCWPAPGGSREP